MRSFGLTAIIVSALLAGLGPPRGQASDPVAPLVRSAMERLGAPGLSIAVWKHGGLVYERGFGLARVADSVPATARTLYRTASVAKAMTVTVVLSLAEDGKIDLDAPIQNYCPAFPAKRWPVTARELLGHTAGVRHPTDAEDETTIHYATVNDALTVLADDSLLFEPGTAFHYSTLGYMLLACAIEGAAGKPYMDVLKERVLRPAGMAATTRDTVAHSNPRRALGYRKGPDGEIEPSLLVDTSFKLAGGGLVSDVEDLARFGGALMEGKLLSESSLEQMFTPVELSNGEADSSPVTLPNGQTVPFGLGWIVGSAAGHRFGIVPGQQDEVSSILLVVPDGDLAIAVQSNLERHARALSQLLTALSAAFSPSPHGR